MKTIGISPKSIKLLKMTSKKTTNEKIGRTTPE